MNFFKLLGIEPTQNKDLIEQAFQRYQNTQPENLSEIASIWKLLQFGNNLDCYLERLPMHFSKVFFPIFFTKLFYRASSLFDVALSIPIFYKNNLTEVVNRINSFIKKNPLEIYESVVLAQESVSNNIIQATTPYFIFEAEVDDWLVKRLQKDNREILCLGSDTHLNNNQIRKVYEFNGSLSCASSANTSQLSGPGN